MLILVLHPLSTSDAPLPLPVVVQVNKTFFNAAFDEERDLDLLHAIAFAGLSEFEVSRTNTIAHAILAFLLQEEELSEFAWGDGGLASYTTPVVHCSINKHGALHFRGEDLGEDDSPEPDDDAPKTAGAPLMACPKTLIH